MANKDSKLPRVNQDLLQEQEIRLIDDQGEMQGVVSTEKALEMASAKGLDLVEVSPDAKPPVCKLLDFGKYRFARQRQKKANKSKQKVTKLKEIKLRPTIDTHDYNVKMNSARKFLNAGDKVKFSLRFRGREITHNEIGMELMARVQEELQEISKVEAMPKLDGRQITMVLSSTVS